MLYRLKGDCDKNVWLDGEKLDPKESQKIINHSPDGFDWGYSGSGPAQLALAIVLKLGGNINHYQQFKREVIAKIPHGKPFEIVLEGHCCTHYNIY